MNYKNLLLMTVMLPAVLTLQAQQRSDSKTLRKSFPAGNEPVLEVNNKYGDIHVIHSCSDSITVTVEITASSSDGGKIDAMMSDVDISMTMTGSLVRAETSFRKGITPLFESVKGLTKNLINFDSRLKIDYRIECPRETALRITNSYGDVYIGDETAVLALKLSNGNLDAAAVGNAQMLELTFSKANVRSIGEGNITLSFSELRTRETGNIKLAGTSSKAWIDGCKSADLDSKRDDFHFGTIGVITGTSYFSDIIADRVTGEVNMSLKYGNLSLENIDRGLRVIDIRSSYADIDMALEERSAYDLEIRHANAFVSLPGLSPEPEVTEINAGEKLFLTKAVSGSGSNRSRIRIDATRGEIRVLQK
ncbi:MAG: hypothetical protein QUS66_03025 [Bacteroidota bacterium]|nr:hypothetical protein [Bacteroidota bacterium]